MTPLVPIVLFGWIPVIVLLFAAMPARRAVIVAFLGAWLFLPMASYNAQGLPAYDKMSATCLGIFIAAAMFDFKTLSRFRPRLFDLPMLLWCLVPLPSCIAAGVGAYEGVSAVMRESVAWGLPYLIGRIYLTDLGALRELAMGIFFGGLVYTPLVLLEWRLSPQLHQWVYGFYPHEFVQAKRGEGWRPSVFMQHGLACATFMGASTVCGVALWRSGSLRAVRGVAIAWPVLLLAAVTVLCKSFGATMGTALGCAALLGTMWTRRSVIVLGMIVLPVAYMLLRTAGGWTGQILLDLLHELSAERSGSLAMRLNSENGVWNGVQHGYLLLGAARFIWGGEAYGSGVIVPDGMWIIAMGQRGLIGLGAFTAALLIPSWRMVRRWRGKYWTHGLVGPAGGLAVLLALYMTDCLANAMINPIYMLAAGGLAIGIERWPTPAGGAAPRAVVVSRAGGPAVPRAPMTDG